MTYMLLLFGNKAVCEYITVDSRKFLETLHFINDNVFIEASTVGLWNIFTEIPNLRLVMAWLVDNYRYTRLQRVERKG